MRKAEKTEYIKVRMDKEMKRLLETEAERLDVPVSQIIRELVRGKFADIEIIKGRELK